MRYIIDTNILLFYISEKDRLSKEVSDLLWDSSNTINVSSRSIEELLLLVLMRRCVFMGIRA